jgi:hypothetical protein
MTATVAIQKHASCCSTFFKVNENNKNNKATSQPESCAISLFVYTRADWPAVQCFPMPSFLRG